MPAAATLDETKAYLRIDDADEDATIARLIAAATELGERFTGQAFVARDIVETVPARAGWTRLAATPVGAITGVDGLPADGAAFALPAGSYAIDIDAAGDGWVRVMQPGIAGRARVHYRAGLVAAAADLPEPLAQGVIRLAAHLYANRDANEAPGGWGAPPAAVAALWRPYRRLMLAGSSGGGPRGCLP